MAFGFWGFLGFSRSFRLGWDGLADLVLGRCFLIPMGLSRFYLEVLCLTGLCTRWGDGGIVSASRGLLDASA